MAKLPSFDSQFEKTKAQAQRVQSLASALAETLDDLPDVTSQSVFETETAQLAELHAAKASVETDLLSFTNTVATRTNDAYAAFDRVDEVGRLQSFFGFFRRAKASSFKAVRARTLAIADSLRSTLLEAASVHELALADRQNASALVLFCEPKLVASMEKRRTVVSAMDEARQRDKELALALSTLKRKINDATDPARLEQLKAEDAETSGQYETLRATRKRLSDEHHVLDRQAVLLGDLIDVLNDQVALQTLVINKLSIEAERCLQLYDAAYGTLEPLSALAQRSTSADDAATKPLPLNAFEELLRLHTEGGVTMQDIDKRKARIDEVLLRRRSGEAKPDT